jgi:hypothetical protein
VAIHMLLALILIGDDCMRMRWTWPNLLAASQDCLFFFVLKMFYHSKDDNRPSLHVVVPLLLFLPMFLFLFPFFFLYFNHSKDDNRPSGSRFFTYLFPPWKAHVLHPNPSPIWQGGGPFSCIQHVCLLVSCRSVEIPLALPFFLTYFILSKFKSFFCHLPDGL